MIQFAKKTDNIRPLYKACFPGFEDFDNYYFKHIYRCENTLLYKEKDTIVSMLQMIPFSSNKGKTLYLYGVCTDEKYRNRGISTKLIQRTFELAKERSFHSVILMPQGDALFNFYKKLGFTDSLRCDINTHTTTDSNGLLVSQLHYDDIDSLLQMYTTSKKSDFFIERNHNFFKWQIDFYGNGAKKYESNGELIGYSFGTHEEDNIVLEELITTDENLCINAYKNTHITYKTPGSNVKLGMIKILEQDTIINGYINLMFN